MRRREGGKKGEREKEEEGKEETEVRVVGGGGGEEGEEGRKIRAGSVQSTAVLQMSCTELNGIALPYIYGKYNYPASCVKAG